MSFHENIFNCKRLFIESFTEDEKLREFLYNNKDEKLNALIILHLSNTYIGKLSNHAKNIKDFSTELSKESYEEVLWPEFYKNTNLTDQDKIKMLKIKNEELVKIINSMNFGKFNDIENYEVISILKNQTNIIYDKIKFLFLYKNEKLDEDVSAELKIIEWIQNAH